MYYTENYHLPQWVKTDRIMMEDFNQMCADLEAGMTENAQTASSVSQNSDALEKKTLRRLLRMAYNHYSAVQEMSSSPWQEGMFHQNPAKDGSNVSGTTLWSGVCFSGTGMPSSVSENLSDYAEQLTSLHIEKGNLAASSPMTVSFYLPGSAYMNRINLVGGYSNNVANTPAPVRLTLTNQDTGEIELDQQLNFAQNSTAASLINGFVDVYIPFLGGQHYLLKLEPLAAVYDAELHLRTENAQTPLFSVSNPQSITAAHTIREHEGSSGGLLIVRGVVNGPDGNLTVKWDGNAVPLQTTRMVRLKDGRQVREMVYFRDEPVPAVTTFSLQFNNGTCSSFLFYDWGAILL